MYTVLSDVFSLEKSRNIEIFARERIVVSREDFLIYTGTRFPTSLGNVIKVLLRLMQVRYCMLNLQEV